MSTDYASLRLKHHGDAVMMERILQRECREKTARKLPTLAKCDIFRFPSLAVAEMATSEAVAAIHAEIAGRPRTVLDMTAGLGVDAIAFASAGAHVTAIEIDPHTAGTLRENVSALGLDDRITVVEGDSTQWLKETAERYDTIFVDPARRDKTGRHYSLRECHPDVTGLMPLLRAGCDTLIIKTSPMLNINELESEHADVAVIGTARECKEMVFIISDTTSGRVECHTVGKGVYHVERHGEQRFGLPAEGDYLLQPFPSVMKGRGTDTITCAAKLHPFSHLFFAPEIPDSFPGEAFWIERIYPFDKRGIKHAAADMPKCNVAVRNFPLTAPELIKRLKIKEGGERMLFGTTGPEGQKLLIAATPVKG